jgi:AcrR family transcriptional regulator
MAVVTQQRFTAEDRRLQILQVATQLFASRGFEGTTTREIAKRAKVNEAIIFRHFPTKEDLYWAVIEAKCTAKIGLQGLMEILDSGEDLRTTFVTLAESMLRRREKDPSLMRLLLFSGLENHRLSQRFFQTYISDYYEKLGEFIQKRVSAGEFRKVNPQLAARGLLGMLVYHSMVQDIFGGSRFQSFDLHEVAENLTDIWLRGMMNEKAEVRREGSTPEPNGNGSGPTNQGSHK